MSPVMFIFMKIFFLLQILNRYTPPNLESFPKFHPNAPPIHQTSNSNWPPVVPLPIHHSPTMSTTIPLPSSPTPLSPSVCFSNDYCAGTGSPSLELHAFSSTTTEMPGSTASSSLFAVVQYNPSTGSPTNLQLYVNLSLYPL